MPTPDMPSSILQDGVKMTNEPPRGVRASLLRTFGSLPADLISSSADDRLFKKAIYSLAFFHAVVLERRKFGPLGYNVLYEFTSGDFAVCLAQLRTFYASEGTIPVRVLKYLFSEINYGGRVTDEADRRLLSVMVDHVFNEDSLDRDDFTFGTDSLGLFRSLPAGSLSEYISRIEKLPVHAEPAVFGLHHNAEITYLATEGRQLVQSLLLIQPASSTSPSAQAVASREETVRIAAEGILALLPRPFSMDLVAQKFPIRYDESMNNVLTQECMRYNRLLAIMHASLPDLIKATKGLIVMSETLDKMADSLFRNAIPDSWMSRSYPSLKPLASWVTDLIARLDYLGRWIEFGMPSVFWLSGFFFPQSFLSSAMQNYSRKHSIAIDTVGFSFKILSSSSESVVRSDLQDGVCIRGLFIEGARWSEDLQSLDESHPLQLMTTMPLILLIPQQFRQLPAPGTVFECRCYKTSERRGQLATTGHSTNYIMTIEIPTRVNPAHWVQRGVACLCSTDD
jgi:dynein heavy chain